MKKTGGMLRQYLNPGVLESGCDEAGRGCLAGPVFAAAVILPEGYFNPLLTDSKLLTPDQREEFRQEIEAVAVGYSVASVSNTMIDKINILKASLLAMHRAISRLKPVPEFLLIDGHIFRPYKKIPHACIIDGDAQYLSIAAASVLAKTRRDAFMRKLHRKYPHYGWDHNMGYATREHRDALNLHGITPFHRRSFRLDEQLRLDL